MGENASSPEITHREDLHCMPWHIAAAEAGLRRDAIMVATMKGEEMIAISLHVATQPSPGEVHRDAA